MSYLVFARKYRPAGFDSVTGQEHVTRTLQNSIQRNAVSHAYLFAGPRGVGKTSIARIFSKALNCEKGPTTNPCLECTNCLEISKGSSLAVREIDGASHNSVDNVRELIDSFRSLPPPGSKYKIYIIDEVHMLSVAAFNALLKSLEEPPPHTVFILATTELHKIPETVISRCQRHEFRALSSQKIIERLKAIVDAEKISLDEDALLLVARAADGSMRDAQSLLDRLVAYSEGHITAIEAASVLGMTGRKQLSEISSAIFSKDPATALSVLDKIHATGVDPGVFIRDFVLYWRDLLICKFASKELMEQSGIPEAEYVELKRQVEGVDPADLQDLVYLVREGGDIALRSFHPRYSMESLVVRMALREKVIDVNRLIEKVGNTVTPSPVSPSVAKIPVSPTVAKSEIVQRVEPKEAPIVPRPMESGSLDWLTFVRAVVADGPRMLGEQLKRLVAESFTLGGLKLRGPEFSINYLNRSENKNALIERLKVFSGKAEWRIQLQVGASGEEDTVLSKEIKEETKAKQDRANDIANHPAIQNLQRVFPGSKIEKITTKENE